MQRVNLHITRRFNLVDRADLEVGVTGFFVTTKITGKQHGSEEINTHRNQYNNT